MNRLDRRQLFHLAAGSCVAAGFENHNVTAATDSPPGGFIDTNVTLFRWPFRRLPLDETHALVDKLQGLGIEQAWAGTFEGVFHRNLGAANRRLAAECLRFPMLAPVGSVNPTLPAWERDVDACLDEHSMLGIRLHPNYHGYTLDDPRLLSLLKRVTAGNGFVQIVVAIEDVRTQPSQHTAADVDLRPLVDLMRRVDAARVQILNARPKSATTQLFAKVPGVFFDTARVDSTDGVPRLRDQLPMGRVLFGSHAPFLIPESALIRVHESDLLSRDELSDVLSKNAQAFLGHKPREPKWRGSESALGLPPVETLKGYRIWDSYFTPSHSHPGRDGSSSLLADVKRTLPAIEKAKFEKLCYFAHVGVGTTTDSDLEASLRSRPDQVLEPLRRYPNLLIGMIQLNANDVRASLDAINRWIADGPMRGVYFPGGGPGALVCTHRNFSPLVERISELRGVIMQHTWFNTLGKPGPGLSTPSELAELARRFPQQTFLCAHAGGEWQQGIRAVAAEENIFVETSGFDASAGFLEMAVAELGAERIVFGSHLPSRSLGTELGKVIGAKITEHQKRLVLGENYRRLIAK